MAEVLPASRGVSPGSPTARAVAGSVSELVVPVRSRNEKEALVRLKALSHLPEPLGRNGEYT